MTEASSEPTLEDVIERLDKLAVEQEKFNDKFTNYQQAMQWVVQIAVTLLISATVALVISALVFIARR
jgi:magnesium-transporting ATPase (P-type)